MDNTVKRIGLWALGALLPRPQVFDRHIRHMARGVTYLVCGGMIIAAIFLALLAAVYGVLIEQGLSVATSAAITITMALLGAIICFLMADRALNRAAHLPEELKMASPALPKIEADLDLQEGASVLLHAFLAGFRGSRPSRRSRVQADLFDDDEDKNVAEVHVRTESRVERDYDEDKDIIRFRPRHQHYHEAG